MALFSYTGYLRYFDSTAFTNVHGPGDPAPYSGIYKCESCGHEVAIPATNPLPKMTHPRHSIESPIEWRLIVYAQHNSASSNS